MQWMNLFAWRDFTFLSFTLNFGEYHLTNLSILCRFWQILPKVKNYQQEKTKCMYYGTPVVESIASCVVLLQQVVIAIKFQIIIDLFIYSSNTDASFTYSIAVIHFLHT